MADGEPRDPLVGQTLRGVYLVQERIADGVAGAVYRAVHTALDAPFAVKILKSDLHPDLATVTRFRREARALSRLRHPNIVAVTDFGQTDDGTLFVVMEYVSGRSLAGVIAEEAPLPERRVVRIGAQVLAALAEAHGRQVLHGALSPKDVMIEARRDPPDSVKVLDFGAAAIHAGPPSSPTRTLAPAPPAYASPEQAAGGDVDARSDLYAVGVLLYELLTGTLPLEPGADPERRPPPPSARLGRPVSRELEALVLRALARRAYDRPETAADMREELLRCPVAPDEADGDGADCGPTVVLPRDPTPPASRSMPAAPPRTPARATPAPRATPARATPARATPTRATPTRATPARPKPPTPASGTRATPPRATTTAALRRTMTAHGAPRRATPSPGIGAAAAQEVERRALALLGPVAPYLVAKAAAVATTVDELCDIVATFIPSEEDRAAFLAASPRGGAPARPVARDRTRAVVAWDPVLLDRARRALAAHIGPVARIVVQRACARARSPEDLCELLAREIADERGRAAFRRDVEPLDEPR